MPKFIFMRLLWTFHHQDWSWYRYYTRGTEGRATTKFREERNSFHKKWISRTAEARRGSARPRSAMPCREPISRLNFLQMLNYKDKSSPPSPSFALNESFHEPRTMATCLAKWPGISGSYKIISYYTHVNSLQISWPFPPPRLISISSQRHRGYFVAPQNS